MKLFEKIQIKSNTLILLLTLYFGFLFNLSFWSLCYEKIKIINLNTFLFAFSLPWFVCVPLYIIFNLIVFPYLDRFLIILLLIISSITNYFMFNFGISIDSDMIRNIFETGTREAFDLITLRSFLWIFITGTIPSLCILFSNIKYKYFKKELFKRIINIFISVFILLVSVLISYKEYASFGRNNRNVRKIINTINYLYSTVRYLQTQVACSNDFVEIDKEVSYIDNNNNKTLLILVIGETARAKNFYLGNYNRNTNPFLSKQNIIYFDNVVSCGTSTAVSLPCMFSNFERSNFTIDKAKNMENILDLVQKVGYDIIWLENDDGCKGVCKRVKTENMTKSGNQEFCRNNYCYDEVLVDNLKNKLKKIDKNTIIVLHTMGSHGPTYYNRYPDKFKVFVPSCDTADIQKCSKESIINAYDNTILYTDFVLSSTIDILKDVQNFETALIYVSDHGESLGENNIYLHGFPYKIAPEEQKRIPMLIWLSENMKKNHNIDLRCLEIKAKNKNYSHDNLYHSILSLLNIKSKTYKKDLDIFNNCKIK